MIARATNLKPKTPNPTFVKDLLGFKREHKKALSLKGEKLRAYVDNAFDFQSTEGEALINIDSFPSAVRQFIELQNRVAGRDVGRAGLDAFQSEDEDARLGPETTRQRLKRENREFWFKRMLETMGVYIEFFEDTKRMTRNARQAYKDTHELLDQARKALNEARQANDEEPLYSVLPPIIVVDPEAEKEAKDDKKKKDRLEKAKKKAEKEAEKQAEKERKRIEKEQKKKAAAIKKALDNHDEMLKAQKDRLKDYKKEILDPVDKELESNKPPSATELVRMQRKLFFGAPALMRNILSHIMKSMRNKFNRFPRFVRRYKPKDEDPPTTPEAVLEHIAVPESPPRSTKTNDKIIVHSPKTSDDEDGESSDTEPRDLKHS